jgi:hypothetical protein
MSCLIAAMALLAGCSVDDPLRSPTAARLKGLATMYLDYAVAKGTGPASEQVFKKHLQSVERMVLEMNGVDPKTVDDTFVSLRDHEPFVIIYGVGVGGMSGNKAPLVAYEKTGVGGKRLAAFANTKLELVDEARLNELKPK